MKQSIQAIRKHPLLILSVLLPLALIGFLLLIAVYSADDFSYSTYFNNGLGEYVKKMIRHYETMNGRVLVHVAAHLILYLGNLAFAAIGMLLTVLLPWFAARGAGLSKKSALYGVGLFAIGVLVIPPQISKQGLLWCAAFCNYFLPTTMLCGLLAWLFRLRSRQTAPIYQYALLIAYAFLCGATTEQSGLLTAVLLLYFTFTAPWHRKKQAFPFAIAAIAALIGVWSIFASPATDARLALETGINQGLIDLPSLHESFWYITQTFYQTPTFCILLLIFFTLGGIKLFLTLKHRLWALWTVLPAFGTLLYPLIGKGDAELYYALLLIAALALAVQLLFCKGEAIGLLVLLAVGSMLVMLPTTSTGGRVLMPLFLYFITADVLLIVSLSERSRPQLRGGIWAAAVGLSLIAVIPMIGGCLHNHKIEQRNAAHAEEAKKSGVLYICSEYDMAYTHTKPIDAVYCLNDYLDALGLKRETTEIYFYDSQSYPIYINGVRTTFPALQTENGELLYPLRCFYETLGASVEWNGYNETVDVTYGERSFQIRYLSPEEALVIRIDADGQEHAVHVPRLSIADNSYLGEAAFTEPFGLSLKKTDEKTISVRS